MPYNAVIIMYKQLLTLMTVVKRLCESIITLYEWFVMLYEYWVTGNTSLIIEPLLLLNVVLFYCNSMESSFVRLSTMTDTFKKKPIYATVPCSWQPKDETLWLNMGRE